MNEFTALRYAEEVTDFNPPEHMRLMEEELDQRICQQLCELEERLEMYGGMMV